MWRDGSRCLGGAACKQFADHGPARCPNRTCCLVTCPLMLFRWTCPCRPPQPTRFGEGQRGLLLGIGAIPGVTGAGITVAVVDSGISAHPALSGKVIANVSKVSGDPSTQMTRTVTARISPASSPATAPRRRLTTLYRGGIAPDVKLVNVRVLGADGTGLDERCHCGHRVGHREPRQVQHSRDQSFARAPGHRAVGYRSALHAVMKASAAGIVVIASAGNAGKAEDGTPILGGIRSPGNSPVRDHRRRDEHQGHRDVPTTDDDLQLARPDEVRARRQARRRGARKQDRVARNSRVVPAAQLPAIPYGGQVDNAYMHLSGTSMSAAVVTGGVRCSYRRIRISRRRS